MAAEGTTASRKLFEVYSLLRDHFGYYHPCWPGTPLEVTLTALLVQQCDWSAAWAGVHRMREGGFLSLPALASSAPGDVHGCIRGVAFAPTKARRLVGLARSLLGRGFREVEAYLAPARATAALRHDLLSLAGVGQETADAILAFASEGTRRSSWTSTPAGRSAGWASSPSWARTSGRSPTAASSASSRTTSWPASPSTTPSTSPPASGVTWPSSGTSTPRSSNSVSTTA
jgi:HhH-GPD superfamily base excision DNA repair protein